MSQRSVVYTMKEKNEVINLTVEESRSVSDIEQYGRIVVQKVSSSYEMAEIKEFGEPSQELICQMVRIQFHL